MTRAGGDERKVVESYMVRIYKRGDSGTDTIIGVVEDIRKKREVSFSSFDELRRIILMGGGKEENRTAEGPEEQN